MNERVQSVLNQIVEQFKSGQLPEAIAYAALPPINIPSSKWSFRNRIIQLINKTGDSRGFQQWGEVNRHVKKGSKAIHILVPLIKKEEDQTKLYGFKAAPVFRYEDTEGEPLTQEEADFKTLPLIERAEEWGIQVRALYGEFAYWGYYASKGKAIALATPQEAVFFHELSHAADDRIEKLKPGQHPLQEITAELGAQALCRMVGRKTQDTTGNSYRYIEKYAKEAEMTVIQVCMTVMDRVSRVLELIIGKEGEHGIV